MDNETRFWIVIALMAIPLVLKFGMGVFLWGFWRVFDRALAEGRVKFTYTDAEEKDEAKRPTGE
jgi:hypothetical protein